MIKITHVFSLIDIEGSFKTRGRWLKYLLGPGMYKELQTMCYMHM